MLIKNLFVSANKSCVRWTLFVDEHTHSKYASRYFVFVSYYVVYFLCSFWCIYSMTTAQLVMKAELVYWPRCRCEKQALRLRLNSSRHERVNGRLQTGQSAFVTHGADSSGGVLYAVHHTFVTYGLLHTV